MGSPSGPKEAVTPSHSPETFSAKLAQPSAGLGLAAAPPSVVGTVTTVLQEGAADWHAALLLLRRCCRCCSCLLGCCLQACEKPRRRTAAGPQVRTLLAAWHAIQFLGKMQAVPYQSLRSRIGRRYRPIPCLAAFSHCINPSQ